MKYWWLVENFTAEGHSTGLYMACQVNMTLTADVNAACKFRRQRTAEFRAADMSKARLGWWRAVEHGFEDRPPEFECFGEPSPCNNPRGCACFQAGRTDRPSTPVGWSDTDWLKHLEEIRQNEAAYARGPLPERGWD